MSIELFILTLCILFGLMLIRISWQKFRNRQMLRSWLNFSLAMFLLSVSAAFAAFIVDYDTFQRLTREYPVAEIEFHHLGPHHYQAVLTTLDEKPLYLDLHGDQWQLDVRMIKWKGAAAWAGIKPMYQIERIAGRYTKIELENTATHTAFSLNDESSPSFWNFLVEYQEFIPWLDAYYGNSVYLPMQHEAKFNISISASGLIAKPANEPARKSLFRWLAMNENKNAKHSMRL